MPTVTWKGPQLFLNEPRSLYRAGRQILDRRLCEGDRVELTEGEAKRWAGQVVESEPVVVAEEQAPAEVESEVDENPPPAPAPAEPASAPEEEKASGEQPENNETVEEEKQETEEPATETVEEEKPASGQTEGSADQESPVVWELKMAPETYLRVHPDGQHAETAQRFLAQQAKEGG